ncbi:TOBE domain-containing protein [Bacillus sp. JJ722]|uniref:TOBE domain-containing protein n=1 Tax=Bacillus sp. JJ722 TaxID=3122973 RepID=UPI003F68ADD3
MNFISGELAHQQYIIGAGKAVYQLSEHDREKMERNNHRPVILGIRPEHVTIQKEKTSFPVTIDLIETIGSEMLVHTKVANKKIVVKTQTDDTYQIGMHIYLSFSEGNIHWFDKENETSLV